MMEAADAAVRRLASLHSHLETTAPAAVGLNACSAAASDAADVEYSVGLPEKLSTDGPWLVHRYGWQNGLRKKLPALGRPAHVQVFLLASLAGP